ncbi:hypothetical protein RDV89_10470 [Nocardioides zeae]|uniref:Uncharacterized protein n=1 Tax=Nocardioides imazamoxiresistens TaxID=3231893 RepID=A0ABU3PWC3_9ACTN|nr:hypothetical protein [Nocardioides zeae]MDT9593491.1 hypothetical protein [Nocardioides zeae]
MSQPAGPRRRRTVLVSSRWAASAAVVAAMTIGAGALAADPSDPADPADRATAAARPGETLDAGPDSGP